MAHYQNHPQLFHYISAQEWGGPTRDYKKYTHKKLNFNTAREGRNEVFNLFFSINSYHDNSLKGRLSCKSRENRVMHPHINKG
jgi:hypothetical protein